MSSHLGEGEEGERRERKRKSEGALIRVTKTRGKRKGWWEGEQEREMCI